MRDASDRVDKPQWNCVGVGGRDHATSQRYSLAVLADNALLETALFETVLFETVFSETVFSETVAARAMRTTREAVRRKLAIA